MSKLPRWWKIVALSLFIFVSGLFIGQDWHPGFFLNDWYPGYFLAKLVTQPDACSKQFRLTTQTLDCGAYDDSLRRLKAVDTTIDTATAQYIKDGSATRISVWVRDLEGKQTASNNENQRYDPASLLKLPLMIAYFKVAEIEPTILNQQLPYATSSSNLDNSAQDIPSNTSFVIGHSYTIEQHIENMIINSDNDSANVLLAHLDQSLFTNTLVDLGIKILSSNNMGYRDLVTAKTYATMFRTLYNASYLNRASSEKALELLSKSSFKGISAPLPTSVTVSHKFGEREVDNMDGSVQMRELHDCGIVYKDDDPYSFCIMTEGQDFKKLQTIIESISKSVYDQM